MKKTDLMVYRDRINKLYKATINLKESYDEFNRVQDKVILDKGIKDESDWAKLDEFMKTNPDLGDKLNDISNIFREINE